MNNVTLEQLAKAFEIWETNFRLEPSEFLTKEEVASIGVSQLSADRASYFLELLKAAD
jgi:hypothetical protein